MRGFFKLQLQSNFQPQWLVNSHIIHTEVSTHIDNFTSEDQIRTQVYHRTVKSSLSVGTNTTILQDNSFKGP